jgi:T5SS/PEP-CTERM-associated repeat protein
MKTKSPSQITRELTKKSPIFATVAALVLCASPAIALADSCIGETTWNVASGSWFVGNNWSSGVPNASTRAQISNGGTATIGSTGAVSCDLTMPASATQSGRLVVDHGGLDIAFDAAVGGYGRGVLIITNGGTVSALAATIAATSGSVGTVSVDGGSFTVGTGFYVGGDAGGAGGTGLLTVTNSATVTAASVDVWKSGT